jgi:hypothetical protein
MMKDEDEGKKRPANFWADSLQRLKVKTPRIQVEGNNSDH